ncbi:hypothetical protein MC885_006370 [Smutsia gigantea]|nr:hypothetical protein MC885_006370 [Smutsia gigantea]
MAVDDSHLYSRTKNKLNSSQNDYKSSRRSSLPPELLIGNDIRGRLQRNIKNLEPIHLRRPKKRPSIFPVSVTHVAKSHGGRSLFWDNPGNFAYHFQWDSHDFCHNIPRLPSLLMQKYSWRQNLQSTPYDNAEQNLSSIMAANEGQREIVQKGPRPSQEVHGGEEVACILGGPGDTKGTELQVLGKVDAQVGLNPSWEAGPQREWGPLRDRLWSFDLGSLTQVNPIRQRRVEFLKGTSLRNSPPVKAEGGAGETSLLHEEQRQAARWPGAPQGESGCAGNGRTRSLANLLLEPSKPLGFLKCPEEEGGRQRPVPKEGKQYIGLYFPQEIKTEWASMNFPCL